MYHPFSYPQCRQSWYPKPITSKYSRDEEMILTFKGFGQWLGWDEGTQLIGDLVPRFYGLMVVDLIRCRYQSNLSGMRKIEDKG